MRQGKYVRNGRRGRHGKQLIGTIAFVLTVASVATVICLAMFFKIESITVTGTARCTPEEVIRLSRIVVGQNIFAIDTRTACKDIYDSLPYVDTIRVRRLLPSSVELVVTETVPAVSLVNAADQYTLLGQNGRVLEHINDVSTEGLPLVVGADLSGIPPGSLVTQKELETMTRRVSEESNLVREGTMSQEVYEARQQYLEVLYQAVEKLTAARYVLEAAADAEFRDVSYYDVGDSLSVSMLYDNRILVKLGTELELPYKMKFAKGVIGELGDSFSGTVDLTTAANNQKSYTREQDIAALLNPVYRAGYY